MWIADIFSELGNALQALSDESHLLAGVFMFLVFGGFMAYMFRPVISRRLEERAEISRQELQDEQQRTNALLEQAKAINQLSLNLQGDTNERAEMRKSINALTTSTSTLLKTIKDSAVVEQRCHEELIKHLSANHDAIDEIVPGVQELLSAMESRLIEKIESDPGGIKKEIATLKTQFETWFNQLTETISKLTPEDQDVT